MKIFINNLLFVFMIIFLSFYGVMRCLFPTYSYAEVGNSYTRWQQKILEQFLRDFPTLRIIEQSSQNRQVTLTDGTERLQGMFREPFVYDRHPNGKRGVVATFAFLHDRWSNVSVNDDRDLLWIYQLGDDGQLLDPGIIKYFTPQDTGQFQEIHIQDLTGDGIPEIFVTYRAAYGGANSWGWQDRLYIFYGDPPYDEIFEIQISDLAENSNETESVMKTELTFTDHNHDGIQELVINRYSGKDEEKLKTSLPQHEQYRWKHGRYERDTSTP